MPPIDGKNGSGKVAPTLPAAPAGPLAGSTASASTPEPSSSALDLFLDALPVALPFCPSVARPQAAITITPVSTLRDYQSEAISAVTTAVQQGRDRALIVIPTGGGKTVTFSEFAGRMIADYQVRQSQMASMASDSASHMSALFRTLPAFLSKWERPSRVLIISHREEILGQNAKALGGVIDPPQIGIVQGTQKEWNKPVVVASVQTLVQEMRNGADLSQFGLVILDEAHHYVEGNEWFEPLKAMGFFDASGAIQWNFPKMLLGVTATPDRLSGKPLNTTFGPDGLAYELDISTLIEKGRLLTPYGISVELQVEGATSAADALRKASPEEKARVIGEVFYDRLHHGNQFQRTIVFVSSKNEVEVTTRVLSGLGIRAVGVTDDTSVAVRKQAFADYKSGKYDALVNVNIATEGFDDVGTEAVVMARATESRGQTVQMVGRSLRPDEAHPERVQTLIVDLAGNLARHQIGVDVHELYLAGAKNLESVARAPREVDTAQKPGETAVTGINVQDLGELVTTTRFGSQFAAALHKFLPTPEAVQVTAFRLGITSDELFRYWNGIEIPKSLQEIKTITASIGDERGQCADAWAWDKVILQEGTEPLPTDLNLAIKTLARHARWGVWRYCDGVMSRVLSKNSPLYDFLAEGQLIPKNSAQSSFHEQLGQLRRLMTGNDPHLTESADVLIAAAVKSLKGWDRPVAGIPPAVQHLLDQFRTAVIRDYGGEIPTTGDDALPRPLRDFLATGKLVLKNNSHLSFHEQLGQLRRLMTGNDPHLTESADVLIAAAVKSLKGWDRPVAGILPAVQHLLDQFRDAVIRDFGGEIPTTGDDALSRESPLRDFLATGKLVLKNSGGLSLHNQVGLLKGLIAGDDPQRSEATESLIVAAVKAQKGWDQPVPGLLPAVQHLLDQFRTAVILDYNGEIPLHGKGALSQYSPLRGFLAMGKMVLKNNSSSSLRNQLDQLRGLIAGNDRERSEATEFLIVAAVKALKGWDQPVPGLLPAVQHLLDHFRTVAIRDYGGEIPASGDGALPPRSPLRDFLTMGKLVLTEKFCTDMIEFLTQHNVPEAEWKLIVTAAAEAVAKVPEKVEPATSPKGSRGFAPVEMMSAIAGAVAAPRVALPVLGALALVKLARDNPKQTKAMAGQTLKGGAVFFLGSLGADVVEGFRTGDWNKIKQMSPLGLARTYAGLTVGGELGQRAIAAALSLIPTRIMPLPVKGVIVRGGAMAAGLTAVQWLASGKVDFKQIPHEMAVCLGASAIVKGATAVLGRSALMQGVSSVMKLTKAGKLTFLGAVATSVAEFTVMNEITRLELRLANRPNIDSVRAHILTLLQADVEIQRALQSGVNVDGRVVDQIGKQLEDLARMLAAAPDVDGQIVEMEHDAALQDAEEARAIAKATGNPDATWNAMQQARRLERKRESRLADIRDAEMKDSQRSLMEASEFQESDGDAVGLSMTANATAQDSASSFSEILGGSYHGLSRQLTDYLHHREENIARVTGNMKVASN